MIVVFNSHLLSANGADMAPLISMTKALLVQTYQPLGL